MAIKHCLSRKPTLLQNRAASACLIANSLLRLTVSMPDMNASYSFLRLSQIQVTAE